MEKNSQSSTISEGCMLISGVYRMDGGYNFTIDIPEDAEGSLLLYKAGEPLPDITIPLTERFRTGRMCSVNVSGMDLSGYEYNYCIDGRIVQDPMAFVIRGRGSFGDPYPQEEHTLRGAMLSDAPYDWEEDSTFAKPPAGRMILYKVHVRGFTMAGPKGMSSRRRGTFSGIIDMIPYLKELGINTLELMPAYEFLETEPKRRQESKDGNRSGQGAQSSNAKPSMVTTRSMDEKVNYWGYNGGFYFAPKSSFCSTGCPDREVRDMVKALHKAGIACVMEFYFPAGVRPGTALRALQFWRGFYHIDGFHLLGDGCPRELILHDGILSSTMLMYAGAEKDKKVFPDAKERLVEYNDSFLKDMRRFIKSDEGMTETAMWQVKTEGKVNYLACQDGFTLNDMVSYNYRHNEDNGQNNQDGTDFNYSWNCGEEGRTRRQSVRKLRQKQLRNAFAVLLLSRGIPMIYAGDEFGNTQEGNNNAWCQDNPVGWLSWGEMKKNRSLHDYVADLIGLRKKFGILSMGTLLKGTDYLGVGFPDVSFHGERAWYVNKDNDNRMFGVLYNNYYVKKHEKTGKVKAEDCLFIAWNFYWEERTCALPTIPDGSAWYRILDTEKDYPACFDPEEEPYVKSVDIPPRSVSVFAGRRMADESSRALPDDHKA